MEKYQKHHTTRRTTVSQSEAANMRGCWMDEYI